MRGLAVAVVLSGVFSSCAVMDTILDVPMSLFDDDGNEVETTVGDALADNADGVGNVVSNVLGGVSPFAALLGGGAAAALLGKARRKKKVAVVTEAAAAEAPETKA